MTKSRTVALLVVGLSLCGLGVTLMGGLGNNPSQGQQPVAPAATGRYQISAYSYGFGGVGAGLHTQHGAYIVDTQTGDVFLAVDGRAPQYVGSVAKAKQEHDKDVKENIGEKKKEKK
jgi:hypothetical protein